MAYMFLVAYDPCWEGMLIEYRLKYDYEYKVSSNFSFAIPFTYRQIH